MKIPNKIIEIIFSIVLLLNTPTIIIIIATKGNKPNNFINNIKSNSDSIIHHPLFYLSHNP